MKFEGRFFDEEKNGNIKEYDNNGKLIFEGEYKGGKKFGYGVEYNKEGKLQFRGGYYNGVKWNGIEFLYSNNKKYQYLYEEGVSSFTGIIIPDPFILNGNYYISGIIKGTKMKKVNNNK